MDCIVLVKQVPDLTDLRPDAWDTEKGTLRRGGLDSVLNPLDLHALTLGAQLRREEGRLIALSMGPPQAEEMLRDCLARCADEAVLLCDAHFAGADTCATARALGQGIRRIVRDFGLGDDYVIVAGMQSADGDTAQVPPQVADELGIEQIAYAEAIEWRDGLVVHRIGPHGKESVAPLATPVLITATNSTAPIYRSFHRARLSLNKSVRRWTAQDLDLADEQLGLKGSRTQVVRIFSPSESPEVNCRLAENPAELLGALAEAWRSGRRRKAPEVPTPYQLDGREPAHRGEVWVFAEHEVGRLHPVSLELLGAARNLGAVLGERVGAVLPGYEVEPLAAELIAHGADIVYLLSDPVLEEFRPIPYKRALARAILDRRPQIVLFGATPLGRELAPRVAYETGAGLTADCTRLEIGDFTRDQVTQVGVLLQTRPALGGNIMATIVTKNSVAQMATVRPAVMKALPADPARAGKIVSLPPGVSKADIRTRLLSRQALPKGANLADAEIVVSGGRGLGSKEAFDRFLRPLAQSLGKVLGGRTEIGASRPAVEEGFIGREHQVGQTGQTIQPRVYVAVAISGAIQHLSGMQNADVVVAINKDPHAPIFRHADFGIVGEYATVLPALIEGLGQLETVS